MFFIFSTFATAIFGIRIINNCSSRFERLIQTLRFLIEGCGTLIYCTFIIIMTNTCIYCYTCFGPNSSFLTQYNMAISQHSMHKAYNIVSKNLKLWHMGFWWHQLFHFSFKIIDYCSSVLLRV